ncbi:MAG: restriction endonuclease [Acidobacteriaceae bacterium]|jgi:hypothetical protein
MPRYSRARIEFLLAEVDAAGTSDSKGAALERFARYLFEKVRGVECARQNVLDAPRAHELDLAFWNDQRISQLYFLDAVVIVECKASEMPVGSAEVGWFVRKLQDRGAHFGILVALNGVTGNEDTSAHSEILGALIRDGIKILLVTRSEVVALVDTDGLADILKRKLLRLQLDRAVHPSGER